MIPQGQLAYRGCTYQLLKAMMQGQFRPSLQELTASEAVLDDCLPLLQDGLIAINYAARALGVTRHMRVLQAMQKCPELQCLHVQTLGEIYSHHQQHSDISCIL